MNEPTIELNQQAQRFEWPMDGQTSVLEFTRRDPVVSFDSVRVPEALRGQGIASRLTRHAMDWAIDERLKVRPACPYVAAWLRRHADYAAQVAE